jgi:hypothetical protein
MSASAIEKSRLRKLRAEIREILWEVECLLPVYFCTYNLHLLLHLPDEVENLGPLHAFWLFPTERLFYVLKRSLHSKKAPIKTIVREYLLSELIFRRKSASADALLQEADGDAKNATDESASVFADWTASIAELTGASTKFVAKPNSQELKQLNAYCMENYAPYADLLARYGRRSRRERSVPLSSWMPPLSEDEEPLTNVQRMLRWGVAVGGERFDRALLSRVPLRGERRLRKSLCRVDAVSRLFTHQEITSEWRTGESSFSSITPLSSVTSAKV